MDAKLFWLINISDSDVNVSLVTSSPGARVLAVGSAKSWIGGDDSLPVAVDESLSDCLAQTKIDESQEPENTAFIVPPYWVGSDGKIIPAKLKDIEDLCKQLKLRPLGFIANDEAIVEDANQREGVPVSFILLNLGQNEMTLSLVYLGRIKERIKKSYSGDFSPIIVETSLLEMKVDNALPPLVFVYGQVSPEVIHSLKNYPWVGKKNVETFLHYPDVKLLDLSQVVETYSRTIINQINPQAAVPEKPSPDGGIDTTLEVETEESDFSAPSEEGEQPPEKHQLEEVDPGELGFGEDEAESVSPSLQPPPTPAIPVLSLEQAADILPSALSPDTTHPPLFPSVTSPAYEAPSKPVSRLLRPQSVKLPRFKFGKPGLLMAIPLLLLSGLFLPVALGQAKVTLFVNPYNFEKNVSVRLDSQSAAVDPAGGLIPVSKKSFDLSSSAKVNTTGKKTVGEKAKGEVTIFNKQDKGQNLAKGTILIDSGGRKYELVNSVQVAPSNTDLDSGVINLGQTKTVVSAVDIGSEGNLAKGAELSFKDHPATVLLAKVSQPFTGGSSRDINAVGETDKTNVETRINEDIKANLDNKINGEVNTISGIIKDSIQIKKNKIDFNREVGEEANELQGTINATITVLSLDDKVKKEIIEKYLSREPGYNESDINPQDFRLEFKIEDVNKDPVSASMSIQGKSLPKIDTALIKKNISGKTKANVASYLKSKVGRVYDYNIQVASPVPRLVDVLPFSWQRIEVDVKTE